MVNLIKNEYIKSFKRKSIFMLLIVMFVFCLFTNFAYNYINKNMNKIVEISLSTEVNKEYYNLNDPLELDSYITELAYAETNKIIKSYGIDSWQHVYIKGSDLSSYIKIMKQYELGIIKTVDEYNLAKQEYDKIIDTLENKDWKDVVKKEIQYYEELLRLVENDQENVEFSKSEIEINIEKLRYRLDNDISIAPSVENTNLESYYENKIYINNLLVKDFDDLSESEKEQYYKFREDYLKAEYGLKNNVNLDEDISLKNILSNFFTEYTFLICLMIVMISAGIISQEVQSGTIKHLLIKPYTRIQILTSKYIVSISTIFISVIAMAIFQLTIGGIVFGFASLKDPVLVYNSVNDCLNSYHVLEYLLLNFIGLLPKFILITSLAFAASVLTNNTAFSTIAGMIGYIGANFSSAIFSDFGLEIKWFKFLPMEHLDLSRYIFKNGLNASDSLIFSICMCIIYLLIMIIPSYISFKNKDIKNV